MTGLGGYAGAARLGDDATNSDNSLTVDLQKLLTFVHPFAASFRSDGALKSWALQQFPKHCRSVRLQRPVKAQKTPLLPTLESSTPFLMALFARSDDLKPLLQSFRQ